MQRLGGLCHKPVWERLSGNCGWLSFMGYEDTFKESPRRGPRSHRERILYAGYPWTARMSASSLGELFPDEWSGGIDNY